MYFEEIIKTLWKAYSVFSFRKSKTWNPFQRKNYTIQGEAYLYSSQSTIGSTVHRTTGGVSKKKMVCWGGVAIWLSILGQTMWFSLPYLWSDQTFFICIGNSTVSRGIWDKFCVIFQNSPKYHEPPRRVIFGEFWNITSRYLSQIPWRNRAIFCFY